MLNIAVKNVSWKNGVVDIFFNVKIAEKTANLMDVKEIEKNIVLENVWKNLNILPLMKLLKEILKKIQMVVGYGKVLFQQIADMENSFLRKNILAHTERHIWFLKEIFQKESISVILAITSFA